jgi:hypothetical protein
VSTTRSRSTSTSRSEELIRCLALQDQLRCASIARAFSSVVLLCLPSLVLC